MKILNFLALVLIVKFAISLYLLFTVPLLGVLSIVLNIILCWISDNYNFHKKPRRKN